MLKGGFGLVDAPNLFTSRAGQVLKKESVIPTVADPKVYVFFEAGRLALALRAHMDDSKLTCGPERIGWAHEALKKVFGHRSSEQM